MKQQDKAGCSPHGSNLGFTSVPFYCEENIWRLCSAPAFPLEAGKAFVVFVSNKNRTVALLEQKVSRQPDGFVLWDYHVFAVSEDALAWDFDTRLPFPARSVPTSTRPFPPPSPGIIVPASAFFPRRSMRASSKATGPTCGTARACI